MELEAKQGKGYGNGGEKNLLWVSEMIRLWHER
jgi:hypothetical protein